MMTIMYGGHDTHNACALPSCNLLIYMGNVIYPVLQDIFPGTYGCPALNPPSTAQA